MADTLYATVLELKQQSDSTVSKYDTVIQMFLNAAAETIDGYCNRRTSFVAANAVRQYAGSGKPSLYIDDCTLVTLVEIKYSPSDTAWTPLASGAWVPFSGDARSPNFNRTPYSALMLTGSGQQSIFPTGQYALAPPGNGLPTARVTAKFGYADEVPPQVKAATIAQAHRWLKRGQSGWSDAMAQGETGMLLFKKVLDPDIQMMLVNSRLVRPALGR